MAIEEGLDAGIQGHVTGQSGLFPARTPGATIQCGLWLGIRLRSKGRGLCTFRGRGNRGENGDACVGCGKVAAGIKSDIQRPWRDAVAAGAVGEGRFADRLAIHKAFESCLGIELALALDARLDNEPAGAWNSILPTSKPNDDKTDDNRDQDDHEGNPDAGIGGDEA